MPVLLSWAIANRQRLLDLNSSLEFKLHRLFFISLLSGGISKQMEALQYARHFQPFASQHQRGRQHTWHTCDIYGTKTKACIELL